MGIIVGEPVTRKARLRRFLLAEIFSLFLRITSALYFHENHFEGDYFIRANFV